ncbi:MAG TPA: nucleotidyltransferase family protein [Woeseiaceae bacterium]|nr:nucleotidyltransferase family protein [Woeseiaceae bacterium]
MTTKTAMILAAGRGERMRPLTDTRPKALLEIGGRSLIGRQLERAATAGIETVVVNLGWLGEMIVERIGGGRRFGLQVVYSPECDRVLETGGGIRRALPLLGHGPFWVLNADVYTDFALPDIELPPEALGHLILVPKPAHKPCGDFDLIGNRPGRCGVPAYTFSGMALYRPELFADTPPGRFPLAPLLFDAADRGVLRATLHEGLWEDVGTPERLAALDRHV